LLVAQLMQPPAALLIPGPGDRTRDLDTPRAAAEGLARPDADPAPGGLAAPGRSAPEPEVVAAAATILSLARLIRPNPAQGTLAAAEGTIAAVQDTVAPPSGRTAANPAPAAAEPSSGAAPGPNEPQAEAERAAADIIRRVVREAGNGTPAVSGGDRAPPPLFSYAAAGGSRPDAGRGPGHVPAAAEPRAAPPGPPPALPRGDHVVIRFTGDHGLEGTVRVAVRGHTIHATILSADPAAAQRMSDQLGALRQSLESHGFPDARLAIHYLGAGDGTSAPGTRDREPRPGSAPEPRHQDQDHEAARHFRRDPHHLPEEPEEAP
jgi:hypothetical protein